MIFNSPIEDGMEELNAHSAATDLQWADGFSF
jgi:hypothetical protein